MFVLGPERPSSPLSVPGVLKVIVVGCWFMVMVSCSLPGVMVPLPVKFRVWVVIWVFVVLFVMFSCQLLPSCFVKVRVSEVGVVFVA